VDHPEVESLAREAGLDWAGVARADQLESTVDAAFFTRWLEAGYAGEMSYLSGERAARRRDPRRVLPGARTAICAALRYHAAAPLSTEPHERGRGWISRYAWGDDYHEVLRQRLERLLALLRQELGQPFEARVYVDTGPVLERALARQTGVGWLGKNTCLLNQRLGSWFFLGEILTTLELPPSTPAADRCGSCTRCLDACPTQALVAPRVLDSTRCISYWTIEVKGAIPEAARPGIGRHVFGCDICQDVCPWNRRAPLSAVAGFAPRPGTVNPPLAELAALTAEDFRRLFRRSPVRRLGYRRFLRNVCVAMGNADDPALVPHLERLAASDEPLIREHARWALDRYLATGRFSSGPHSCQLPS
jgi:epoxyqueuosine reductase